MGKSGPKIAGFEFADGARFQAGAKVDANVVGQHLEMLRKQFKGELTADDVLADAQNANSPLHPFFEWDDSEAARQHRLKQARGLIRAVVAVYVSDDEPAKRMRAYVHVAEPEAPHYREMTHALSQRDTRERVMQSAMRELNEWKRRYADLKEFAAVIEVINELQAGEKDKAA